MVKALFSILLVLIAITLAACTATGPAAPTPQAEVVDIAPTASIPVETPATGESEAACPPETADTRLLTSAHLGYCLLYPLTHQVERISESSVVLVVGSLLNASDPRLSVTVTPANGRTAESEAAALIAEFDGFGLEAVPVALGGQSGLMIDMLPGQDINRRIFVVHDGRFYDLTFSPAHPEDGGYEGMVAMYDLTLDSFTFIPVSDEVVTGAATYGVASLNFDTSLASSVTTGAVPGSSGSPQGPFWDIYAAHVQFLFHGYRPELGYFPAATPFATQVVIYNAADFARLSPVAAQEIERLQAILAERPSTFTESIPFLPLLNATQDLQAQIAYLDFQGGAGVRFLTHYGQEPRPYVNDELFYTFQGLTSDGRYYVSATFPIHTAILPATFAESPAAGDYESFANNVAAYQAEIMQQLNELAPAGFTPHLSLLDAVIQSLRIDGDLDLPETAVLALAPCDVLPRPGLVIHSQFPGAVAFLDPATGASCDVELQSTESGYVAGYD